MSKLGRGLDILLGQVNTDQTSGNQKNLEMMHVNSLQRGKYHPWVDTYPFEDC